LDDYDAKRFNQILKFYEPIPILKPIMGKLFLVR